MFEIEVKRFYVPTDDRVKCPECSMERDLLEENDYLSYPDANCVVARNMHCRECDHEWMVNTKLTVNFGLVKDECIRGK